MRFWKQAYGCYGEALDGSVLDIRIARGGLNQSIDSQGRKTTSLNKPTGSVSKSRLRKVSNKRAEKLWGGGGGGPLGRGHNLRRTREANFIRKWEVDRRWRRCRSAREKRKRINRGKHWQKSGRVKDVQNGRKRDEQRNARVSPSKFWEGSGDGRLGYAVGQANEIANLPAEPT